MSDVELLGQHYRCEKLQTQQAFHIGIKLLPFLQGLAPMISGIPSDIDTLIALGGAIGHMSLPDADFVRDVLLSAVRWRQGDRWVPLRASGGAMLNGAADRLDVQLRLMGEVLYATFFDFKVELLQPSIPTNGMDLTEPLTVPEAA